MRKDKLILTIVGFVVLGIIILPLLMGVIGGIISINQKQEVAKNPLSFSEEEKWLTYKNEEKGFELKYPPEMYVNAAPFTGFTTTFLLNDLKEVNLPPEISPRIQVFASDVPVEEALKQINEGRNEDQFPEFAKIDLNGQEAYQTKALDSEVIFTHTLMGNENGSYLIELFTVEKENEALVSAYDKLLRSFKFTR